MRRTFDFGCSLITTVIIAAVGLLLCLSVQAQSPPQTTVTATVVDPQGIPYAFGTGYAAIYRSDNPQPYFGTAPLTRVIIIPGINGTGTFSMKLWDNNLITPNNMQWRFFITDVTGVCSFTTAPITVTGSSVNLSSFISTYAVPLSTCGQHGGTGGGGPTIQTNETNNQLQNLLDFQNGNESPAGKRISWSNLSGGIEHAFLTNVVPATGGSAFIGDETNPQIGDEICHDLTNHLTNCTPAIIPVSQTAASYPFVSTNRGQIIYRSNSGAMTDTIPQAGTTGFATGFYLGIQNDGPGTETVTSTTSVFKILNGSSYTSSSSLVLTAGQYAYLYDNGTDYLVNISASGGGAVERTCMMQFGSDGAAAALATTDYFPQMSVCYVKAAGVVDTVIVMADAGASTVRVGFDVNGSYTQISPTLTPATVSGIADKVACANTGGTPITIKGTSVTCSVLSSTSIAAGQYFETSAGTADGTTKRLSIAVTWQ